MFSAFLLHDLPSVSAYLRIPAIQNQDFPDGWGLGKMGEYTRCIRTPSMSNGVKVLRRMVLKGDISLRLRGLGMRE